MFQFTLRQLLAVVTLFALAIVSLKFASDVWVALVSTLVMVALLAALVIAVIDRAERQASAIGFCLIVVAYGLIVTFGTIDIDRSGIRASTESSREFNPSQGELLTSQLLGVAYYFFKQEVVEWPGLGTQQIVRAYPKPGPFMRIGHMWWALVMGYAAAFFAQRVYEWRARKGVMGKSSPRGPQPDR